MKSKFIRAVTIDTVATLVCVALLLFIVQALGYRVLFTWDQNPVNQSVTNYWLHLSTNADVQVSTNHLGQLQTNHVYDVHWSAGNNTTNLESGFVDGVRYYIAITAENAFGQSGYSAEVSFIKPTGPFLSMSAILEGSTNVLGPWTERVVFPVVFLYTTNNEEILRVKLNWTNQPSMGQAPMP